MVVNACFCDAAASEGCAQVPRQESLDEMEKEPEGSFLLCAIHDNKRTVHLNVAQMCLHVAVLYFV